jgi:hypothetical protein
MIGWLELLHSKYKWSYQELMDADLRYVLDLIVVRAKMETSPQITPIDQSGIF